MPLNVIQRQLGHANLGTTSIYLQGIDTEEIIATVHARRGADDVRHRRTPALTTRHRDSGSTAPLPLPARAGHRFENQCDRHEDPPRPPFAPGPRPERA